MTDPTSTTGTDELTARLEAQVEEVADTWHEDPEPYNRLMLQLSKDENPKVRAWVGTQEDLPEEVQKALMFDDPDEQVRIASSANTEVEHEIRVLVFNRCEARLDGLTGAEREAVLRELASSYVALERDFVASYADTPTDVRQKLAQEDPHWRVRRSAVSTDHTDPAMLDRYVRHVLDAEEGDEDDVDETAFKAALQNPNIPHDTLRYALDALYPGSEWWSITMNDKAPGDVLDTIARTARNEWHGDIYYTMAVEVIAKHRYAQESTLQALLASGDPEVVESVQEGIEFVKEYGYADFEDED